MEVKLKKGNKSHYHPAKPKGKGRTQEGKKIKKKNRVKKIENKPHYSYDKNK